MHGILRTFGNTYTVMNMAIHSDDAGKLVDHLFMVVAGCRTFIQIFLTCMLFVYVRFWLRAQCAPANGWPTLSHFISRSAVRCLCVCVNGAHRNRPNYECGETDVMR